MEKDVSSAFKLRAIAAASLDGCDATGAKRAPEGDRAVFILNNLIDPLVQVEAGMVITLGQDSRAIMELARCRIEDYWVAINCSPMRGYYHVAWWPVDLPEGAGVVATAATPPVPAVALQNVFLNICGRLVRTLSTQRILDDLSL